MSRMTESAIEEFALALLEKQGYQYAYGPDIAPDSDSPSRLSFADTLLPDKLRAAVARINPTLSFDVIEDAVKQVERISSPDLIANIEF